MTSRADMILFDEPAPRKRERRRNKHDRGVDVPGARVGTMTDEDAENELEKHISPPGALGLPPLLDERRVAMKLPDELFQRAAVFDRIMVYQYHSEDSDSETYLPGGRIIMTEQQRSKRRNETPCGLLVSAGLSALDNVRSNGMDLGHEVTFIEQAPYRMKCLELGGRYSWSLLVLRDGDLITSKELQTALKDGKCRVEYREVENRDGVRVRQHVFVDEQGQPWTPTLPWNDLNL